MRHVYQVGRVLRLWAGPFSELPLRFLITPVSSKHLNQAF